MAGLSLLMRGSNPLGGDKIYLKEKYLENGASYEKSCQSDGTRFRGLLSNGMGVILVPDI